MGEEWRLALDEMFRSWMDSTHVYYPMFPIKQALYGSGLDWQMVQIPTPEFEAMFKDWHQAAKKKNWKWSLTDQWGQRTRVKYVTQFEGQSGHFFLNYSMLLKTWSPIVTNEWCTVYVSALAKAGKELFSATAATGSPVKMQFSRVGMETLVGSKTAVAEAQARNHTYNHHRNHTTRVPKSADGRVRA